MKNSSIKVVIHDNSNPGKAAISDKENTVNSAIDNAGGNEISKSGVGVRNGCYRIVWDLVEKSSSAP